MSAFIIKVKTDNTGTSNSDQFTLPGNSSYSYNFDVDWGDGSPVETINTGSSWTHTFTGGAGTYSVSITENVAGGFPTIYFNLTGDRLKLLEIEQWGTNRWDSFNGAFSGCSNLTITATDEATADTGGVGNFVNAWFLCSSLTSFPLIDTSGGLNFQSAWRNCSALTSFPLINTSNCTSFYFAWSTCSSLTSFPLIDTSSGTDFGSAWHNCSSLTSFPLIDTSSGTKFNYAWYRCSSITSFPLINTSSGTDFGSAWDGCGSMTSFPLIDTSSGTKFDRTWLSCSSLTSFPTLDFRAMSNGTNTFVNVTLDTASYDAILEKSFLNNTNNNVTFHGGNSTYFKRGKKQRDILTASPRNWTITDGGYDATHVYPDWKDGLQGWWCPSLDTAGNGTTTLTDLSGNGNNGTLTNMDAATDWVADTTNGGVRALDYDGTDYVAASELAPSLPFSVSCWFSARSYGGGREKGLVGEWSNITVGQERYLLFLDTGGQLTAIAKNGSNQNVVAQSASAIATDTWIHACLVADGSDLILYADGALIDSTPLTTLANPSTALAIGGFRVQVVDVHKLNGRIDPVAIWVDRALTADEVTQLYNGGRSLNLLTGGIITTIPRFSTNNLSIGYDPLNGNFIL